MNLNWKIEGSQKSNYESKLHLPCWQPLFFASQPQPWLRRQQLTGTLTDSMCTKGKHVIPGKSDAECARACVKAGAKWALVSKGKVYLLQGDQAKFDELAGKRVRVTGDVNRTDVGMKQMATALG